MNAQTALENAENFATTAKQALLALNAQQADRLTVMPDAILDYSQIANRIQAQAEAIVGADIDRVRVYAIANLDTPEEQVAYLLGYVRRGLRTLRTPSSTSAVSNAMDAALGDARLRVADLTGALDA